MNCAKHPETAASAYCRTCGKALCPTCTRDVRGVIYCEECLAARLSDTVPPGPAVSAIPPVPPGVPVVVVNRGSNPVAAALLSLIPGVGQMYNEQYAKGLIFVLIFAALIQLTSSGLGGFGGFLIAGFYIFQIIDAHNTARARQLGLPLPDPFGLNDLLAGKGASAQPAAVPVQGYQAASQSAVPGMPGEAPPVYVAASEVPRRPPSPTGAIVLIALGAFFLLNSFASIDLGRYWPLVLIGVGVWIFVRRRDAVQR